MVVAPDREDIASENNTATTRALAVFFIKGSVLFYNTPGLHHTYPAFQKVIVVRRPRTVALAA